MYSDFTGMKKNRLIIIVCNVFLSILLLPACAPRATVPIPVLEYGKMDASDHKNLLIFLRGLGGSHKDFEKFGLIDEVRTRNLPFDVIVPDAHFGYYKTETLPERLKEDIIEPAKEKGYRQIWLAGFSMGGLGGLFSVKSFPDEIDGIILVSPFVGWPRIIDEINASGGVDDWDPQHSSLDDWQWRIWKWIKSYGNDPGRYPPIYLGYSDDDFMAQGGPVLLSTVLDPEYVLSIPGDHDYETFRKIWNLMLDKTENTLNSLP